MNELWWVLYEAKQAKNGDTGSLVHSQENTSQHDDRRGGQHRQKVQLGKQYRQPIWWGGGRVCGQGQGKLEMVYWEEEECWKVSRGKEQSGWGVNVEPVNILQGTRICVEVACSHQYLGRGSPHCIGLCRPHSWGFWWLRTIIYNEICKSARQYIFSFTPFTLESFVTQIRLPHPIIHSSIHPSNSYVCLSCTCVLELLEPIPADKLPVHYRSNTRRQTTIHALASEQLTWYKFVILLRSCGSLVFAVVPMVVLMLLPMYVFIGPDAGLPWNPQQLHQNGRWLHHESLCTDGFVNRSLKL